MSLQLPSILFRKSISSYQNFNRVIPQFSNLLAQDSIQPNYNLINPRYCNLKRINQPRPETYKDRLRFKVHYPEDGKYTVKKLKITKLGGRDPITGRIIFGCIGGGWKHDYYWVQMKRVPPEHDSDTLVEKILQILVDPHRTARIALVGQAEKLRYIIATTTMKPGDLISSTTTLTKMPIRPVEGYAYPVGSLPLGTKVCCIEINPGLGASEMLNGGCTATVLKKTNSKVHIRINARREFALDPQCMVTVGQVSNPENKDDHIGSPWRMRWLGIRPRSGLFQRKSGKHGRKAHPLKVITYKEEKVPIPMLQLHAIGQGSIKRIIPCTNRKS